MPQKEHGLVVIRLGSLGDIVHTIPAVAALRQSFPEMRLDWVVEERWADLVGLVTCVDHVIPLRRTLPGILSCARRLRQARYSCAIDFQGLYKSALVPWLARVGRRIGRDSRSAREPGAAFFYTDPVSPEGTHVAEMSLSLARRAGAHPGEMRFPMSVPESQLRATEKKLLLESMPHYVLLSPGGGWRSKCWPAERYGALCQELWRRHRLRAVLNAGPGEEDLVRAAAAASGAAAPLIAYPSLLELAAFSARARVVVAADTGPLHLAAALGTPVVGLFGPTNPERNGPLPGGRVLRNSAADGPEAQRGNFARGDYLRGDAYSPAMLSITVEQVLAAVEEEMSVRA